MTEKLYRNSHWLYQTYWEQEKSLREMAKLARCSYVTIIHWMNKHNIPRRSPAEAQHLLTQTPQWRKAHAEGIRRMTQDPKWRETMHRLHQDPEYKRKYIEGVRRRSQDPEWRRKRAERNRCMAQDPKWLEAVRRRSKNPEWRRNVAKALRQRFQDPEYRRKHTERMHHLHQDPEYKRIQAEAMHRLHQDPKFQEKLVKARHRLALKKRKQGEMTDIEAIVYNALQDLGLKEGKDFDFEVPTKGGYTADFLIYPHDIVLEAYGEYWHNLPGKQEYDAERKQFLEACGYTVLIWWGPDIKTDVYKLIDEELLPLLDQPSRMERPPHGVSRPYRGPHGWQSAIQLSLFDKEPDD